MIESIGKQMADGAEAIQYLTLAQAARLCPYTQEYLSLRARTGKLRAVKRGRSWCTTKEWLSEYLQVHSEKAKTLPEAALQRQAVDYFGTTVTSPLLRPISLGVVLVSFKKLLTSPAIGFAVILAVVILAPVAVMRRAPELPGRFMNVAGQAFQQTAVITARTLAPIAHQVRPGMASLERNLFASWRSVQSSLAAVFSDNRVAGVSEGASEE